MNIPKNLNFEKFFKESYNEFKWEFKLNLKKICIKIFLTHSSKLYQLLYNNKLIKQGEYNDNCNIIKFIEEEHSYEININSDFDCKLYIDNESFEDLYKKEKPDEYLTHTEASENEKGLKIIKIKEEEEMKNKVENKIKIKEEENKRFNKIIKKKVEETEIIKDEEAKFFGIGRKGNKRSKEIIKDEEDNLVFGSKEIMLRDDEENEIKKSEKKSDKFLINIKFLSENKNIFYPKRELSGLLNLCLIKYMANFFDNKILEKIPPAIKNIILKLQNNISFTDDNKEDIKLILKEKNGNNILIYSQYVNMLIKSKQIDDLIKYLNKDNQNEINRYWGSLSNYEEYNSFFEEEFQKDLKNTYFDYSVISLAILEKNEEEEDYKKKRDSCPNVKKRILYHGSQIDPISSILTEEFKYTRKNFYGMGIYFTDIIDYIAFYCGGTKLENRRNNFGITVSKNSTFSFIASEVFYDKNKFKQIDNFKFHVKELNDWPTYEDLKENYPDKMIKPNGIHFIRVDKKGLPLSENNFLLAKKEGKFVANEYVITEKYQIFPIYSLTLKRNEYFVLWRDPNFFNKNKFSKYLMDRKLFIAEKANMNIYFENSIEDALKFLLKRKYNKVILISNIGKDLSGKKFVEIARKIFGFDLMVLFFSVNEEHLKWIQKFPNCLYTNANSIYEEYILNFNEKGLKNLKTKVEKKYNIKLLDFSKDFLSYPNFMNEVEYSTLTFKNYNSNFRHVKICCENNGSKFYLSLAKNLDNVEACAWYVTIIDDEITFFSYDKNYLDLSEDNENICLSKYMKIWKFAKKNDFYYFKYPTKKTNNILSIRNGIFKVNQNEVGNMEKFKLIDV